MSLLLPVTVATFERDVIQSPIPVLVDFYAANCPPCRAIRPLLEKMAAEFAGRVAFVTIDIDAELQLAARYEVFSIPMLLLLRRGEVVQILTGAFCASRLRASIETSMQESFS